MKTICLALAAALVAQADTRPRPHAEDYSAHQSTPAVAIAAERLPPEQVKNLFTADLHKYIVVEVAVYPVDGHTVYLRPADFLMKNGKGQTIRAAAPAAVAATKHGRPPDYGSPGRNVDIYPNAGIEVGHVSGPYGHGTWTSVESGVGVGVGPGGPPPGAYPYPQSTARARDRMERELSDKSLEQGAVTTPVAGYLYFPSDHKKNVTYDLVYYGDNGKITIPLK